VRSPGEEEKCVTGHALDPERNHHRKVRIPAAIFDLATRYGCFGFGHPCRDRCDDYLAKIW
jgi:hypothetical protein